MTTGKVAYEETGEGPPVVLMHANLHDHRDFDPIVPALAEHYRVIAIDWPGHGQSGIKTDVTAGAIADTLAEFVEKLDLEPAVFIGNSIGGYAAARLALDHPDRVAGLVLVQPGGFTKRSLITRAYCRAFGSSLVARRWLPRIIRTYMKASNDNDRAVVGRVIRFATTAAGQATYSSLWRSFNDPRFDLTEGASGITAPTLIVWGKLDPVIPLRYGKVAHKLIAGSQLEVMNTGHLPFSSMPNQFLRITQPFVQSVHATSV
ncbi:alpha/beta fold hydrolase (plasmid) [Mycolicibacterium farcinogenes]|uniref:Alpha/beta fold hydrolase n=2 Tax=Mycolicibacterium farcinogenes TaxID=1802 RepID=A0ACD1FRD2_MYCFR|nr:alpha/beta fold hydrolase [Mycolicibacterium farcinogenes]